MTTFLQLGVTKDRTESGADEQVKDIVPQVSLQRKIYRNDLFVDFPSRQSQDSAQSKMDQLVALMMEEEKIEPSEQFVRILQNLDPSEVGRIWNQYSNEQINNVE